MRITADHAPASAPGDLHWDHVGDVVEVADEVLAAELLRHPGFRLVPPEPVSETVPARKNGRQQADPVLIEE